jgi:Mn-dependent DtxR family transcriptional regulator
MKKNNMNIHSLRILELIKKERVITSSELAKYLKVNWNTADKYLLELAMQGKIERIKKEGVNLWLKK